MIVFVEENAEDIAALRDALLRARMHSACVTPREISRIGFYPVQAVLVSHPERIQNLEAVLMQIRDALPGIPCGILHKAGESNYYRCLALNDLVIDVDRKKPKEIGDMMRKLYEESTGLNVYNVMKEDLRTNIGLPYVSVYSFPITVPPTVWLILRYLQLIHPRAASPEELLDTCFSHTKKPSLSNVRTQISTIYKIFGHRCTFIPVDFVRGEGYVLCRRAFKEHPRKPLKKP